MPRTADQPFHAASSPAAVEPAKRLEHPNLILAICCMSVLIFSMDATIVTLRCRRFKRTCMLVWRGCSGF